MLYDDSEQLEVRHVISLMHYNVSIYAGGEPIPEGELWIKRNCIRLTQRAQPRNNPPDSKPYYIFSENCSEKEDFYHAILQSLEHSTDTHESLPRPLKFDTPDLVRLVQQLHASEENLHTRWINALIGRIFLAMYKTPEIEKYLWTKVTKKIARVPKPALISAIKVQRIDMGNLPPFITNPKLKELTVDGDLTVEADLSYKGNLCLEISAIARIELGSRFKAREVTLVLASILKSLEGHILVRVKPPPSNRIWFTFETVPKMEFSLEPIVSSRQITYGVILRAIESRIREVVSETLVLPNWDDIPFSDTILNHFRGGIWTPGSNEKNTGVPQQEISEQFAPSDKESEFEEPESQVSNVAASEVLRGVSSSTTLSSRRQTTSTSSSQDTESTGISSATEVRPTVKPKSMRSGSFASVASPIVNMNSANASVSGNEERNHQSDAASAMKTITKSQPASPSESPVGSPSQQTTANASDTRRSTSPASFADHIQSDDFGPPPVTPSATIASLSSNGTGASESATSTPQPRSKHSSSLSLPRNAFGSEKRQSFNQSLNSATAVAKKWLAARQNPDGSTSPLSGGLFSRAQPSPTAAHTSDQEIQDFLNGTPVKPPTQPRVESPLGSPAHPIGRGQPLPPPGTPLPPPSKPEKKNIWSMQAATFANLTRRKPASQATPDSSMPAEPLSSPPPTQVTDSKEAPAPESPASRRKQSSTSQSSASHSLQKRRQRMSSVTDISIGGAQGPEMFVVEAPQGSAPTSPTEERDSVGNDADSRYSGKSGYSGRSGSGNSAGDKDSREGESGVFQEMELEMEEGVT